MGSAGDRAQENAPRRRMIEQRANEMPMFVELRGLAYQRHDAVGLSEVEQGVYIAVRHRQRGLPERLLRVELAREPAPPRLLVRGQRCLAERVAPQRGVSDLGCD